MTRNEESHLSVKIKPYAIEKAQTHIANMPNEVAIVGCDFHQQTLVDKRVDVVFCNPPYSEYVQWATRIVKECSAKEVFLIIPRRWRDNTELAEVINEHTVLSLGEYDFSDAERQARAQVEIIRISINRTKNEAFDAAIEEMLPELKTWEDETEDQDEDEAKKDSEQVAESGDNLIRSLVAAYDKELAELYESYHGIVKIRPSLLRELGVQKSCIVEGLRMKISGLKGQYWKTLFSHLGDVKKRLATKQRAEFLESLKGKAEIDFTEENALALLIWVAKNATSHFDQQLIDVFAALAERCNVVAYKSNKRVFSDGDHRYLREDETHYKLDFRLVLEGVGGSYSGEYWYNGRNGLRNSAHDFLSDLITVANNLGYACEDTTENRLLPPAEREAAAESGEPTTEPRKWKAGERQTLHLNDGEPLTEVRAFKNQNLHLRPSKEFILAINVQAGKLLGWLHSADQAVDELGVKGDEADIVTEAFALTNQIDLSNSQLLLTAS